MRVHSFEMDRELYLGESVRAARPAFVGMLLGLLGGRHGRKNYYLIYMQKEAGEDDRLEIQHSSFLKDDYYKRHPIHVYGVAATYSEAMELIVRISDEAASCGMAGELGQYLRKRGGRS